MDSIRVTWNAEQDLYYIHIPGFPGSAVTFGQLQELQEALRGATSGSNTLEGLSKKINS